VELGRPVAMHSVVWIEPGHLVGGLERLRTGSEPTMESLGDNRIEGVSVGQLHIVLAVDEWHGW